MWEDLQLFMHEYVMFHFESCISDVVKKYVGHDNNL
jgi:hypothetical protein